MVIDAPIRRTLFEGDMLTIWGTDKTWGKYTADIGRGKLKLRWTKPFGPDNVVEISETNVLSTINVE